MQAAPSRRAALQRGAAAEQLVASLLSQAGWSVLATNWRGGGGELDLVIARDGVLRFVEVKARKPHDPRDLEIITPTKQARLSRAADAFLLQYGSAAREMCFLVAYVTCHPNADWTVEWIDDAFDGV